METTFFLCVSYGDYISTLSFQFLIADKHEGTVLQQYICTKIEKEIEKKQNGIVFHGGAMVNYL